MNSFAIQQPLVQFLPHTMPSKREIISKGLNENRSRLCAYAYAIVRNVHLAEDVVQEAAITMHKKVKAYDKSRPFLRWALGIVRIRAFEAIRQQERQPLAVGDEVWQKLEQQASEIDAPASQQNRRKVALAKCLAQLSKPERKLLDDFYIYRKSAEQLTNRQHKTEAAVYSELQRLREKLSKSI